MVRSMLLPLACLVSAAAYQARVPVARRMSPLKAQTKLDMNDPAVNKEFTKVQKMSIASASYELDTLGIPVPPLTSDMDIQLMLMEARVRLGQTTIQTNKNAPSKTASVYEKVCFEKPKIRSFADSLYDKGDINAYNTYINTPEMAKSRYGDVPMYNDLMDKADAMLSAPAFTSNKLDFTGFPAAMGQDMIKMSFEEFGPLKSFVVSNGDDMDAEGFNGQVEYEDVNAAKAAVARYDGADMGMGDNLALNYV